MIKKDAILLHIPHSSAYIPSAFRKSIILSDNELQQELLKMTDRYTDELFDWHRKVVVNVSRLVCDVERFLDSRQESMTLKGMGICYNRTSDGAILRENAGILAMANAIQEYYLPHQQRMNNETGRILDEYGECLIIDCHSFPSKALPYEDSKSIRPEICIGYDEFHKDEKFIRKATEIFLSAGYSVCVNTPFRGSYVPSNYYLKNRKVKSVMIELRRDLYMNEKIGKRQLKYFTKLKKTISEILESLVF